MFCTNCGSKLTDNALFCHICGASVEGSGQQPVPVEVQAAPAEDISPEVRQEEVHQEEVHQEEVRQEEVRQEEVRQEEVHQEEFRQEEFRQEDVSDVTIVANKWIPDEMLPEEPEAGKKKKSRKGLIISLSAVVAVLAIAVGLAFLFSGRYSGKVDELESYHASALISEMMDEYTELLGRAKKSEGVLHVFETFSLGSEIDKFLERIDHYKSELPQKALEEQQVLEKLGQKYYIGDWEEKIGNNGLKIKAMIDGEDYESLVGMIREDSKLETEIIDGNRKYREDLQSVINEIIDIRNSLPACGLYREDVYDFIEKANLAVNTSDFKSIPGYLNKGTFLTESIKEANRPYKELSDRKEYYDALFEEVEVVDRENYNRILMDYTGAIAGPSDVSVITEIVSEYAELYEKTHEENTEEYLALREKIDSFDTGVLNSEEYAAFDNAYRTMTASEASDNLLVALTNARECMTYVDKYVHEISESEEFLELISVLPGIGVLFGEYTGELSEREVYYICEYLLSDEQIGRIRDTLGWGAADPDNGEKPGWRCGFSRAECEELAYYITGNRHYFYKEISSYAEDFELFERSAVVKKSDFDVSESFDGTIDIEYKVQIMSEGQIYNLLMHVVAADNEDSFFDKFSVMDMTIENVERVNYANVYLKALKELYDRDPEDFGDDMLLSRHMSLVCIDNDFIPELYIDTVYGAYNSYLVTYIDNENYSITFLESGDGFSEYIAGEGVIRIYDGRMGYYYERVIEIGMDGNPREIFSGEHYYVDDPDNEELVFNISLPEVIEDVDMMKYYEYLDELYTLKGESCYLTADYTYNEMTTLLTEEDKG